MKPNADNSQPPETNSEQLAVTCNDLFSVDNGRGGYLIQDANGKTIGSLTRSPVRPCIWHLRDGNNQIVDYDRYQNDIRERRGIRPANEPA